MTDFTATRDDATAAVLGAVLITQGAALDVTTQERIRPHHFVNALERLLYQGMLDLAQADQPIDAITLTAHVEPRWPDTAKNTPAALVDFYSAAVPALGNLRAYCRIVHENSWYDTAQEAVWDAADALERRDRTSAIAALSRIDADDQATARPDSATEFIDWYEAETKGIPLPFSVLTEAVGGGLQPGEVTILGGWPGMRKTFFAKDMMLAGAAAGARCHEYANEMSGPRLTARLMSSLCGIPAIKIRNRNLDKDEWDLVFAALKSRPYETTPTAGWSVDDYCRDLRRNRWDMAVIDTVTNLPCKDTAEWDRACGMLADTAAQTGTQLVLLSQLRKERDSGQVKPPPTGGDLRNTGAWYMRARVVMFVHFDQELIQGTAIPRLLSDGHVRVDKATHGEPEAGFVPVTFNPKWLRLEELDAHYRPLEAVA